MTHSTDAPRRFRYISQWAAGRGYGIYFPDWGCWVCYSAAFETGRGVGVPGEDDFDAFEWIDAPPANTAEVMGKTVEVVSCEGLDEAIAAIRAGKAVSFDRALTGDEVRKLYAMLVMEVPDGECAES